MCISRNTECSEGDLPCLSLMVSLHVGTYHFSYTCLFVMSPGIHDGPSGILQN